LEQPSRFFRRHDADARIESALEAIRALLPLALLPAHKRELISICLWKLTEADGGKYGTRYRSEAALDAPRSKLAHEHVYQRARMVRAMLAEPHRLEEFARRAVGCVVTREEHKRLTALGVARPELDGWARYEAAEIRVVDCETGRLIGVTTAPQSS
jgi:hypothetical protein